MTAPRKHKAAVRLSRIDRERLERGEISNPTEALHLNDRRVTESEPAAVFRRTTVSARMRVYSATSSGMLQGRAGSVLRDVERARRTPDRVVVHDAPKPGFPESALRIGTVELFGGLVEDDAGDLAARSQELPDGEP